MKAYAASDPKFSKQREIVYAEMPVKQLLVAQNLLQLGILFGPSVEARRAQVEGARCMDCEQHEQDVSETIPR